VDNSELNNVGEKVVKGLRDNLLRPMHDSLASRMNSQHEAMMQAVIEELPNRLMQSLADGFKNVRWDNDESK